MSEETWSERLVRYRLVEGLVDGGSALEIGSGDVEGAAMLARTAARVVSVGPSPADIARVRASGLPDNVSVQLGQAEQLSFASDSFDLVVVPELHLWRDQLHAVLREVGRVLKPAGVAMLAAPSADQEAGSAGFCYEELLGSLSAAFAHVRVVGEIPFQGRILADFQPDPQIDPALDCSLVQEDEAPRWYMALCSEQPVAAMPYTVLQVPGVQDRTSSVVAVDRRLALLDERIDRADQYYESLTVRLAQRDAEGAELRREVAELRAQRQADQWRLDEISGRVRENELLFAAGDDAVADAASRPDRGDAEQGPRTAPTAHESSSNDRARPTSEPAQPAVAELDRLRKQVVRLQAQLMQANTAMAELEQLRLEMKTRERIPRAMADGSFRRPAET